MTKTNDYYHEEFEDDEEEYLQRRQREDNEYYLKMMDATDQIEFMDLDVDDISEEELFRDILDDESDENDEPRSWEGKKR
jgi:hypothetical protein